MVVHGNGKTVLKGMFSASPTAYLPIPMFRGSIYTVLYSSETRGIERLNQTLLQSNEGISSTTIAWFSNLQAMTVIHPSLQKQGL